MRKGIYKEGQASDTAVHITFFDESSMPIGGHLVVELIDDPWNYFPYKVIGGLSPAEKLLEYNEQNKTK